LKKHAAYAKRTFPGFCSEISVVLFKHGKFEFWVTSDHEKSPAKVNPLSCGCSMNFRVNLDSNKIFLHFFINNGFSKKSGL